MNVYIWKRCGGMTDSYHHEGGAVAIAETLEDARAMMDELGFAGSAALTSDPDIAYPVPPEAEPYAEIFPDAGCC